MKRSVSPGTLVALGVLGVIGVLLVLVGGFGVLQVTVALIIAVVILATGLWVLRAIVQPPPEPPASGELRKVELAYRCGTCGAEVNMTVAPDDDPAPPRHCMEEMELVTPVE
ncbi:MAG: hypothetical protein JJLCMIEE_01144 [Acidimicrobiales bacterium]|nr:MAG: hypothetical protein EDR02_11405 [Actinomycetota bacterium]MBV6508084.1 hypothetical protein [Acidimicrobiales bacterium]RIK05291.1 MAG: hypothetical protein DCC48_10445 [Acidobacteriota bacterium]